MQRAFLSLIFNHLSILCTFILFRFDISQPRGQVWNFPSHARESASFREFYRVKAMSFPACGYASVATWNFLSINKVDRRRRRVRDAITDATGESRATLIALTKGCYYAMTRPILFPLACILTVISLFLFFSLPTLSFYLCLVTL